MTFASRTPESGEMKALVAQSPGSRAASAPNAVADAEVVLLSTPWHVTRGMVTALNLQGKILIDATNPILPQFAGLEYGNTTSGAENVTQWAPGAHVVKAFNTIGFEIMQNPAFGDARAALFYCGDDAGAKQAVHQLALDLGFDPYDAGPLARARILEPHAMLWISLAMMQGLGRQMAFHVLRR